MQGIRPVSIGGAILSELYYGSGRKTDLRNAQNVEQKRMGTTLDGDDVYHTVYYNADINRHISYDTVVFKGAHCYIVGSGHERPNGPGDVIRWDPGNEVTWKDALQRRTSSLIIT